MIIISCKALLNKVPLCIFCVQAFLNHLKFEHGRFRHVLKMGSQFNDL